MKIFNHYFIHKTELEQFAQVVNELTVYKNKMKKLENKYLSVYKAFEKAKEESSYISESYTFKEEAYYIFVQITTAIVNEYNININTYNLDSEMKICNTYAEIRNQNIEIVSGNL